MFDNIIQNFNLLSFSLALAFFLIISSVSRLVESALVLKRARRQVKDSKAKLDQLQQKLASKSADISAALKGSGIKDANSK